MSSSNAAMFSIMSTGIIRSTPPIRTVTVSADVSPYSPAARAAYPSYPAYPARRSDPSIDSSMARRATVMAFLPAFNWFHILPSTPDSPPSRRCIRV